MKHLSLAIGLILLLHLNGKAQPQEGRIAYFALIEETNRIAELHVLDLTENTDIVVTQFERAHNDQVTMSTDGRIAFITAYGLEVWDLNTYTNVTKLDGAGDPAWSADGRLAYADYQSNNYEIYIWDGLTTLNITRSDTATEFFPTWSADGRLAFVRDDDNRDDNLAYEVYIWDGTDLINISQSPANDTHPSWSADGRLAFLSDSDGFQHISLWNGQTVTDISAPQAILQFVWGPEGQIAFVSERQGTLDVQIWGNGDFLEIGRGGSLAWSSSTANGCAGCLAFAAFPERTIMVWDGETLSEVPGTAGEYEHPTWSNDGRLAFEIASQTSEGYHLDIGVWDGQSVQIITDPTTREIHPVWVPST